MVPAKDATRTGTVRAASELRIKANKNSFQDRRNTRADTATTIGAATGTRT